MTSESSGAGLYFMRDRNRVSGPFDLETLRKFARGQRLARHHQLSTDRLTWVRAVDLLPDVFSAAVRGPARNPEPATTEDPVLELDSGVGVADVFMNLPPPVAVHRDTPWGMIVATVAIFGGLLVVGILGWAIVGLLDSRWSDSRIAREITPAVTVVRGMNGRGDKESCFGVIVSRNHIVTPIQAAQYRTAKIETVMPGGENEWHSAALVLIDPVAKLAVVRADLGDETGSIEIPEGHGLPRVDDDLYLVAPDRKGMEVVCRAELDQVMSRGEPDQSLVVSLKNDEPPLADEMIGRAVIDAEGRFVAIVVGVLPDGRVACTASHEVRIKRTEAKRLPVDQVLSPVDLAQDVGESKSKSQRDRRPDEAPSMPSTDRQSPPRGEVAEHQDASGPEGDAPVRDDSAGGERSDRRTRLTESPIASGGGLSPGPATDRSEEPATKKGSKLEDGKAKRGRSAGLIETMGDVGSQVVSDVTDAVAPQLSTKVADELGERHRRELLLERPRCSDTVVTRRVERLCGEVLKAAKVDSAKYVITVVEDDTVNAYSFVGRNVVVTSGFMKFAGRDDDMIRFVLAHEVGHLVLGHTDAPYRRLEAAGSLVPGGAVVAGFSENIFRNSPMSQADETAADCFAADCLRRAGHSIEGARRFFEKIDQKAGGEPTDEVIGALFASHPDSSARISNITRGCGAAAD
jgi:putative metalloprotease